MDLDEFAATEVAKPHNWVERTLPAEIREQLIENSRRPEGERKGVPQIVRWLKKDQGYADATEARIRGWLNRRVK